MLTNHCPPPVPRWLHYLKVVSIINILSGSFNPAISIRTTLRHLYCWFIDDTKQCGVVNMSVHAPVIVTDVDAG